MALKLLIPLPQTKTVPIPEVELHEVTEAEALTEEYLTLYEKLEEIGGRQLIYRMEEVRKQLHSIANELVNENVEAVFQSVKGNITFSPRVDTIAFPDISKLIHYLIDKFGEEIAYSVLKVSITDLRKVLSQMEIDTIAEHKPGSRIVKKCTLV